MTVTVVTRVGAGSAPAPTRTFYELGDRIMVRRTVGTTEVAHVPGRIVGFATRRGQLLYLVTFPKDQRAWIDEHSVVRLQRQGRTP